MSLSGIVIFIIKENNHERFRKKIKPLFRGKTKVY
jgi:hypothetical protein